MKRDMLDLTAEIQGVSRSLCILSTLFEAEAGAVSMPTNETIVQALFAAYTQLDRIAEDLDTIDAAGSGKGAAA